MIVGRGAPWFLRDRPDTFNVFLYAPRPEKVRRLIELVHSPSKAIQLLNTIDDERIAFVKRYFGKQWPTRTLYQAMLNTLLGDDLCVSTIINLINAIDQRLPVETGSD